ncbi:hypothetical protein [Flavonifractor plautii]|uniref:hypothetical protein n=1 Tax=Flavonifractor plautii TaxID=292800 RepID=UPI000B373EDE|nr:hypothetical protein [Flavonifractor plautii]OUO82282.1 hypothetical protein B5F52_10330 [Flavonifractor plautii]
MNREELTKLPGRPEEQAWLRERLEMLTVREGIALDAALQRHPAQDSTEAVSLLTSLDGYEVLGGIQSYEDLGLYYLEENDTRLLALRDYIDLDKLGRQYEAQHPGLFVGGCYVVYPEREQPEVYDGIALPEPDYSWSLRLKLASSAVPDGVWLALPDYNDIMDVRPGEIQLALDALGVQTIRGCTLLEARCSLPGITGLEDAYAGRLEDLIYDGQNLGFILQEQNQGQKDFLQTYLWALEHEGCTTLPAALEVAQHLNRYHVVYTDQLQDVAKAELRSAGSTLDTAVAGCFNLEQYGLDLLRKKGYTLTEDGCAYIARQQTQAQAPQQMQQM